jgi:hypothetical protein
VGPWSNRRIGHVLPAESLLPACGQILVDASQTPEADRGLEVLRHRRGLQAGRLAATRSCIMEVVQGNSRGVPLASGMLQRPDVIDAAIPFVVKREGCGYRLTVAPCHAQDEPVVVGVCQEAVLQPEPPDVFMPGERCCCDLRARPGEIGQVQGHRSSRRFNGKAMR